MSSRTAACRCGTTRGGCPPIKVLALIPATLLAVALCYAADEKKDKPAPNRVERAAKKAAQNVDKAATRAGKAVERTAKRTGKALDRAADKTENWIKKQTE